MGQVSNAVAKAAEQAQTPEVTPAQAIAQVITRYRPVIRKLLIGTGINDEQFEGQIANAMRANPMLWNCTPTSVLGAALRCAQLGLAPNDPRNLAWIIPYRNRDGQFEASFQLGYGGVTELAMRAVPGLKFDGRPVYPNDRFEIDFGEVKQMTHKPHYSLQLPRGGDAYAWYVRARYPDGAELIHALDREGVEYHRSFSKQPNGQMWTDSYDAAALKSVVLDMKRWLPASVQLATAIASDEQVITPEAIDAEATDLGEVVPSIESPPAAEPTEATEPVKRRRRSAQSDTATPGAATSPNNVGSEPSSEASGPDDGGGGEQLDLAPGAES
jgi:recombination protein RecT